MHIMLINSGLFVRNILLLSLLFIAVLCSCGEQDPNQGDDKSKTSVQSVPKLISKENIFYQVDNSQYHKFHFSDDLSKAISWYHYELKLWDVATRRILKSFDFNNKFAQINHDGSQILTNSFYDSKHPPVLIDSYTGKVIKIFEGMVYAEFTNTEPAIKTSERRLDEKIMNQDGKLFFFRKKYNSPKGYLIGEDRKADFRVSFNSTIKNVAFSKDNSLVAIAADKKIHFYRYNGNYRTAHQFPYEGHLNSMAFSQDKKLLQLSFLNKKTNHRLEVRSVDSGEILYQKEDILVFSSENPPLFSADGQFIFVPEFILETEGAPKRCRMVKINWATQERIFETDPFRNNQTIYLTSDDKNLVVGNMVFDANTGQKKVELKYHLNSIGYFDINNTGNLWTFNNFKSFLFDKETQSITFPEIDYWQPPQKSFKEDGYYYTGANSSMQGGALIGEEIGGLIKKEVDPEKLAEAQRIIIEEHKKMEARAKELGGFGTATAMEFFGPGSPMSKIDLNLFQQAQQGKILSAAYSPNGRYIAAISDLGRVYLLNAKTRKIIRMLPYLIKQQDQSLYGEMCQIFFSHNSQMIVYENINADKIVYSIPQKDTLFTIDTKNFQDAILHPEKEEILFSKEENILQTVDLKSGERQFETTLDTNIVFFKYAKNGDEIMVITSKQEVYVYDAMTGALVDSGAFEKAGKLRFVAGSSNREWACYLKGETHISVFQNDYHCYDFYPLSDGDWAAISPNGYFDGTEKGLEKLYFSNGQRTKSLAEFPNNLHLKGMLKMEAADLSKLPERDMLTFF